MCGFWCTDCVNPGTVLRVVDIRQREQWLAGWLDGCVTRWLLLNAATLRRSP